MIHVGKLKVNRKAGGRAGERSGGGAGIPPLTIVENIEDISKKAASKDSRLAVISSSNDLKP